MGTNNHLPLVLPSDRVTARWLRYWLCLAAAVLASCATRTKPTTAEAPQPGSEQAPLPRMSHFEERWLTACGEDGLVGVCPAASGHRIVYFDAYVPFGAEYQAPFCSPIEPQVGRAIYTALSSKRAALRACFTCTAGDSRVKQVVTSIDTALSSMRACCAGAADELWVKVGLTPGHGPNHSPELPAPVVTCVSELTTSALAQVDTGLTEAVVIGASWPDGMPLGSGSLSKASLLQTIRSHMDEVRACKEAALDVWSDLTGTTRVKFLIDSDGSVAIALTDKSTLKNPALECCINTAARGWRFDKPTDRVVVSYPFALYSDYD